MTDHVCTEAQIDTTQAPQEAYQYDQLPESDVFRYLILEPGVDNEPLKCSLKTATLFNTQFNALSYVWGTSVKDHTITCDGYLIKITQNLAKSLRCLRLPDEPLKLWADSICINQENLKEKGHQVAFMNKIYQAAECTLIYIGSDDDDQGSDVCSLLDEIDNMIEEVCKKLDTSDDTFPDADEDDPILADSRWNSLLALLTKDWFDRGWVVQEASLAQRSQLIWGESRISWDKLMRTYIWHQACAGTTSHFGLFNEFLIDAHKQMYMQRHGDFARVMDATERWSIPSMLTNLEHGKGLQLGDPRDRVYAFIGLPLALGKTYRTFAIQYVKSTKTTELLKYVDHSHSSIAEFPSWIPRWDLAQWPVSAAMPSRMDSRTNVMSVPTVNEDSILCVRGVLIDTVLYVSDLFDRDTTTMDTFCKIWANVITLAIDCPYNESGGANSYQFAAFLDSLARAMSIGDWSRWEQSRDAFGHEILQESSKLGDENRSDSAVPTADQDASFFFGEIKRITNLTKFIVTQRGYMGLAPEIVCKGDLIGIIFGCQTPSILRKTDQEHHYKFGGGTPLIGKSLFIIDGYEGFSDILGDKDSKDWIDWDVEEQDIYLC
ncbi:heterokaryon incompatibility protein-domain-containing protein [Phaeosphaeriaceae sp. PMI808]|nr:heterokaryon incompatibility protein-domain-containing protein [Phaeosphaeriaceae sp. PMI808]